MACRIIDAALQHRAPAYVLGAKLVELFPSRHLIDSGGALELRSLAHAGTCSAAFREGVY